MSPSSPLKPKRIYVICAMVFFFSALAITIDKEWSDYTHDFMRPYDHWLQLLTTLGDGVFLVPAMLVIALVCFGFKKRHPNAFKIPLTALIAWAASGTTVQLVKIIVGRPRPYTALDSRYAKASLGLIQLFTINKDFSSFPSGHSTAIFSVTWVAVQHSKKRVHQIAWLALATAVAFSRIALWKHYIADTFAGAALGIFFAQIIMDMIAQAKKREGPRRPLSVSKSKS